MNLPLNTSANISDPVAQARYNMIEQQIRPLERAGCRRAGAAGRRAPRRLCASRLPQPGIHDIEVPAAGQ